MCKCDDDCVCDCCGKCDCEDTVTTALPPMPQLQGFPNTGDGWNVTLFQLALASWERVCLALISKVK